MDGQQSITQTANLQTGQAAAVLDTKDGDDVGIKECDDDGVSAVDLKTVISYQMFIPAALLVKYKGNIEKIREETSTKIDLPKEGYCEDLVTITGNKANVEKAVTLMVQWRRNMLINLPCILVMGGPGCGKGTQCDKIKAKYGLSHLSSGDLLMEESALDSIRGNKVRKIMEAGQLVPQEVILNLVIEAMLAEVANGSKGFLIDGYPTTCDGIAMFEKEIMPCTLAVYFEVSLEVMTKRLLGRGRADDKIDKIKLRLKTFHELSKALPDYCEKKAKLARISAEGNVDAVFTQFELLLKSVGVIH